MRTALKVVVPGLLSRVSGVGPTYANKVLAIEPASLIAYWPLNETGGTTALDASGNGRNGTYSGVALNSTDGPGPTMGRAPSWNGTTSYCNIYSASLVAAFSPAAGTFSGWAKNNAWGGGVDKAVCQFRADNSNRCFIISLGAAPGFRFLYAAGGVTKFIDFATSSAQWLHVVMTWDQAAGASGEFKAYVNGVQVGTTQTGLGTWAGALASGLVMIGAFSAAPLASWSGNLQGDGLWSKALTAAQIASLADPNPL